MTINSINALGGSDRFFALPAQRLDRTIGNSSSDLRFDEIDSVSATRLQNIRSFSAHLQEAIEQIKFENEKLLFREENSSEADERIRNIGEAEEAIEFASYNLLSQSGSGMLTQANLVPESALRLLS
jgi:flagellin-like hook-associated protein FlgL